MDAPGIFNLARELTHTNISDYPNSRLLPFLNAVKDDFWSTIITAIRSNYNWDIWTIDNTVVNQSEYIIPAAATDAEGSLKISNISMCYDGNAYDDGKLKYIPATEVDPKNLPNHWNYYINNQSSSAPIYYTADKSIFIAPAFSSIVADGIELKGIKSILDYTVTTTEPNLKVPSYLHNDLVAGVLVYIYRSLRKKSDAQEATADFNSRKAIATSKIANRSTGPSYMNYPTTYQEDDIYTVTLN